jgi:tRNA pseudouridine13 synthase
LQGCGGLLKQRPEDFVVEEVPKYPPCGSGEHLFLLVEKRGITTRALTRDLARAFALRPHQVGYAGQKDAHAVSRQWVSLHTSQEGPLAGIESPAIRVLRAERHRNKLRLGHLRENRFRIVVREAVPPPEFGSLVEQLVMGGFPNYFGAQRFGADGDNAREGRRVLRERPRGGRAVEHGRFLANAYQSALFNELVAMRLAYAGRLDTVLAGDLAVFRDSGAFFSVSDEDLPQACARAGHGLISASAPLFGYKVPLAQGVPGKWECEMLAGQELTLADFKRGAKRHSPKGERRAVRAFPAGVAWRVPAGEAAPVVELEFSLPPGTYATVLLRELMKNDDLCHQLEPPGTTAPRGAQDAPRSH